MGKKINKLLERIDNLVGQYRNMKPFNQFLFIVGFVFLLAILSNIF